MSFEKRLIHQIQTLTEKRNRDNIQEQMLIYNFTNFTQK